MLVVVTPPPGLTTIPAGVEASPPAQVTVPVPLGRPNWSLKPELSAAVVVPDVEAEVIVPDVTVKA